MKYLITIMLIVLSINVFTADRYVVCENRKLSVVTKCVNDYLDEGYKTLSGLHAVSKNVSDNATLWFQALLKD